MSATDRLNRLLVAEDWKRIYQSFRNAEFKSYDFDTLRRVMVNYLRENYPEDFNDYIESSEYLALIDLIAFLGQNISYRVDLNARENFLELAERRESVLRLARMLSYNPKRNQPANGLLKLTAVSTTEDIFASNGNNLRGQTILWNDPSNSSWREHFTKILNSSLPTSNQYGNPIKSDLIGGVSTDQYKVNGLNLDLPVYSFDKPVEGITTGFEIVSTDIENGSIVEEIPLPGNNLGFLYRDDGKGPASSNSGFFVHFRQGKLENGGFEITSSSTNQIVNIDAENINNSDVWLYKLNNDGVETEYWTKVDALEGNNVIYNSLNKKIRNFYSVLTRVGDRINLVFPDGVFGNLPNGQFRCYYRTSQGKNSIIVPSALSGITIKVDYLSRNNTRQTITLTFDLQYTVSNGTTTESNASIKRNAPSTYYTQNRMITAEDYNVAPLGISQKIIKAKTVNRTSSGISRYFDVIDATGKYSTTNLFSDDGVIYTEKFEEKTEFSFGSQADIEGVIINTIQPILKDRKILNFYYDNFPKIIVGDLGATWNQVSKDTNRSTGYFSTEDDSITYNVGTFTANSLRLIEEGTLCKFVAPTGFYFMTDGSLKSVPETTKGIRSYVWSKVISVRGNGTETISNQGAIVFNDIIPEGAILQEIRPRLAGTLIDDVKVQILDQAFAYNRFGLRYDDRLRQWRLITDSNLNTTGEFSTGKSGDGTNAGLDASWLLLFETNGNKYTITTRQQRYVFESDKNIRFYYDSTDKIFDSRTGKIVKDYIKVLNINYKPDDIMPFTSDFTWQIVEEYRDQEGYIDTKKIQISFYDSDDDGVIDDPDLFDLIVDPATNPLQKIILQKRIVASGGEIDYRFVDKEDEGILIFESETFIGPLSNYEDGQKFYFTNIDLFKAYDSSLGLLQNISGYKSLNGRSGLKFHYVHSADEQVRIDPSSSNIMDCYLLTREYDNAYRTYLKNSTTYSKPLPPSSDQLFRDYGAELNKIKSISDEIVYHPVKYKNLFGSTAKADLQATFMVVKNSDVVLNDNDVKSRILTVINRYFSIENWDFGDTFYFSELSAYVINELAPDIVSFLIVPKQGTKNFGKLFEIKSESDEIFINSAKVSDIEIIDQNTATKLKTSEVVISYSDIETGITSSSATTGGYSN